MSNTDGMSEHGGEFEIPVLVDESENDSETKKKLEALYRSCYVQLGGTRIPVHLEDEDYQICFKLAYDTYVMMSERAISQTYGFLTLTPGQQIYHLNERIDNVIEIIRGNGLFGGIGSGSSGFESFGAATANLLLRGSLNPNRGNVSLLRYDLMMQYSETLDRLFARQMQFKYHEHDRKLHIYQTIRSEEVVILHIALVKRIKEMLNDHWANRWLNQYTLARLRMTLGEKYRLFGNMPGAQGGTTLKGDALKTKAENDLKQLEQDLLDHADAGGIAMPIRF